jgi:autotransporter-associated beta strand protein
LQIGNNMALGTGTLFATAGRISSDSTSIRSIANAMVLSGTVAFGDSINTGALTVGGSVTLAANSLLNVISVLTLSGVVSGTSGLLKIGGAELTLSGLNTYTGSTNVSAGSLTLSGGSAVSNASILSIGSAASVKLSSSEQIGGLAGFGAVNLQSNALTLGSSSVSTTYSGSLYGTGGSLVKSGSSVLTLLGASAYTGGTDLSAGAIRLGNNTAIGAGAVVFRGGTLSSDAAAARTLASPAPGAPPMNQPTIRFSKAARRRYTHTAAPAVRRGSMVPTPWQGLGPGLRQALQQMKTRRKIWGALLSTSSYYRR